MIAKTRGCTPARWKYRSAESIRGVLANCFVYCAAPSIFQRRAFDRRLDDTHGRDEWSIAVARGRQACRRRRYRMCSRDPMALAKASLRRSRCSSVHDQKTLVLELKTNGSVSDSFGEAASCLVKFKTRCECIHRR